MTKTEIKERAKRDLKAELNNYVPDESNIEDMTDSEKELFFKYQEQLIDRMLKIVEV